MISILSTAKRYGDYGANFIFGTGSSTIGTAIGDSIKNRKAANMSLSKSILKGFKDGFVKNNNEVAKSGGFIKNLLKTFKETPAAMGAGWKSGNGFFSSLKNSIKPLGKLMPFAMNALWFAQSLPDIIGRTKEEGIWGGIKETGKTLINMATFSISAAVGGTFGLVGMFGLPILTNMITSKIIGKTYGEKKAEEAEAQQLAQQNNPFTTNPQVGKNLDITSAA